MMLFFVVRIAVSDQNKAHMNDSLQRRLEISFELLILAVLVVFFVIGLSYPARPRELPLLVGAIGIVLVLKQLVGTIRLPGSRTSGTEAWNWRAVFLAFGSMAAYLAATLVFGMVLSSVIIVYGGGVAFGAKNRRMLALITGATVLAVYLLFVVALRVPLYPGLLPEIFPSFTF
jgi:hypothetical protein